MSRSNSLIDTLFALPSNWALTPVRQKIPYVKNWQDKEISRKKIADEIRSHQASGFALLNGARSGGIMAIDCDGHAPHELFRQILGGEIPCTTAFTSGTPDRAQYLFQIDPKLWAQTRTRKFKSEDGMLEFRWDGSLSVLPPSAHPTTNGYKWIYAPPTGIVPLPDRAIDYLKEPVYPVLPASTRISRSTTPGRIPIERLLSIEHRHALAYGVAQGGRDDMAYRLARDLLGVASSSINQIQFDYRREWYQLELDGDPAQLLWDYCQRCNPPLTRQDYERILRSAQRKPATPSIRNPSAIEMCLRSWCKETIKN
jgi:Bifunctional DNA primase/polymerase, N-terminal